jgi:putative N6-adenine-specific DNA methylase
MRIATFGATNFRQLEKRAGGIPWELYLPKDAACEIHVTTRQSRLFHTGAVAEAFKLHLAERLGNVDGGMKDKQGLPQFPQQVFVRALNDRFTVSIDSSGDLLHKRGLKIYGGRAPIRETVASGILVLAGYVPGEPFLDPMCGAGTFSLEAAMIANRIPAGWYRRFAFMGWPCFRPSRWKHIRREAEKSICKPIRPHIFASDTDPANCRTLKNVILENHLSDTVIVSERNFFDLLPPRGENRIEKMTTPAQNGLIAINPPFGRRLKTPGAGEKMFVKICKKLKSDFKGWKIALIAPKTSLVGKVPFNVTPHGFFHGGLKLTVLTGRIS